MADDTRWSDARQDYITSSLSYRQIAKKYGVSIRQTVEHGKKEKWVEAREQYRTKTAAKKENIAADAEAKRYKKMLDAADLALEKLITKIKDPTLDEKGLRAVFASLKDYKDVTSVRSSADAREQDARIANLERQAAHGEQTDEGAVIEIEGLPEAWRE